MDFKKYLKLGASEVDEALEIVLSQFLAEGLAAYRAFFIQKTTREDVVRIEAVENQTRRSREV